MHCTFTLFCFFVCFFTMLMVFKYHMSLGRVFVTIDGVLRSRPMDVKLCQIVVKAFRFHVHFGMRVEERQWAMRAVLCRLVVAVKLHLECSSVICDVDVPFVLIQPYPRLVRILATLISVKINRRLLLVFFSAHRILQVLPCVKISVVPREAIRRGQ